MADVPTKTARAEWGTRFGFLMAMIGAMVGVREALHFEVDVWPELSRRAEAFHATARGASPAR